MDPAGEAVVTSAAESNRLTDDRKLVAAILQRDRKAAAEFVVKYADQIYLYVRSRLIPRMDLVDDLVQDVFLAAWENLTSYRGDWVRDHVVSEPCDCPGFGVSPLTGWTLIRVPPPGAIGSLLSASR